MTYTYNYKKADEGFWHHVNLTKLTPIWIPLPKQPTPSKITNYGLKPEKQKFQYEKYPEGLKIMERELKRKKREETGEHYVTLEELRNYLISNKSKYEKEIEWIKTQWYYRLHGKWFYIKGKAYHIDGWHWFYLNYYTIKDPLVDKVEYRDRDRRWFQFFRYIFNEKKEDDTFANLGINDIENRRQGKTSRVACIHLELASRTLNFDGGIQGKDESNSSNVYTNHIVYPFRKFPWFFKPLQEGSTDPKRSLSFKPQSVKHGGKGTVLEDKTGLESVIDYATTADESHYDNTKKTFIHVDEGGKDKKNISSKHLVLRRCVIQGNVRSGFMGYTTTVEETESDKTYNINITKTIKLFEQLCNGSHYDQRPDGRTATGLVNSFWPSDDGLEGYIDEYGFSLKEQAREAILNDRKKFEDVGDLRSLAKEIRKFPLDYPEIFTPNSEDVYFDRKILTSVIQKLKYEVDVNTKRGDFKRSDPTNPNSPVMFVESEFGKFNISFDNFEKYNYKRNDYYVKNGIRYPKEPKFIASADPFRYNKTKTRGRGVSEGGGAVFWMHDENIDPLNKEISEYESYRFVLTYENRPESTDDMDSLTVYCEDMLMMSEYFGAFMFSERNVSHVNDYFERRGRAGYLLHKMEIVNGQKILDDIPGFSTQTERDKDELFKGYGSYLEQHGYRERHLEIAQDALSINGLEDMGNYDRLTAVMGCLKGLKSHHINIIKRNERKTKRFSMGTVYGN